MLVAIAAESIDYDASVYARLLAMVLDSEVDAWASPMRFGGESTVFSLSGVFLARARDQGIEHALLAVDNDGGARRRPQHVPEHHAETEAASGDGCRWCKLSLFVPAWWVKRCMVVPVQTLETWLLVARGDLLANPVPEQNYARPALKKRFFGPDGKPPAAERTQLALTALATEGALARLRERPSFQLFESQLGSWR